MPTVYSEAIKGGGGAQSKVMKQNEEKKISIKYIFLYIFIGTFDRSQVPTRLNLAILVFLDWLWVVRRGYSREWAEGGKGGGV